MKSLPKQLDETAIREAIAQRAQLMASLEDRTKTTRVDLSKLIHGPLDEMSPQDWQVEMFKAFQNGENMILTEHLAKKYNAANPDSPGINLVWPMMITPQAKMPYIDWLVTLGNPADVAKIVRTHVKKSDIYGVAFLGEGVLSTRDNELWMDQRKHLQEAFLPGTVLATQVFPKSAERARFAVGRLGRIASENPGNVVEFGEFLLHEAMAQLQLALFGETEAQMDSTNIPVRKSFAQALNRETDFEEAIRKRSEARRTIHQYSNGFLKRAPQGPLGKRLIDNCPLRQGETVPDDKIKRDTVSTFVFAGHETTANLMTWCLYELAKAPHYQRRVRAEIDSLFEGFLIPEKRELLSYADLKRLPFLSRLLTETLRLWPSVPNGTFREIEFDDTVTGKDGKQVTLPKGTQVNIPVWLLHMSAELWGPTVERFDPDRDFLPEEIWNGQAIGQWNPQSHRYMPFTSAPRDCIGKNFAQAEARVILCELLRAFEFELAEPTKSQAPTDRVRDSAHFLAMNNGTMSPKYGIHLKVIPRKLDRPTHKSSL